MAAKFDGKHARANMWVTHQNLAKAKGGRPLYKPKDHKSSLPRPKNVAIAPSAQAPAEPTPGGTPASDTNE